MSWEELLAAVPAGVPTVVVTALITAVVTLAVASDKSRAETNTSITGQRLPQAHAVVTAYRAYADAVNGGGSGAATAELATAAADALEVACLTATPRSASKYRRLATYVRAVQRYGMKAEDMERFWPKVSAALQRDLRRRLIGEKLPR